MITTQQRYYSQFVHDGEHWRCSLSAIRCQSRVLLSPTCASFDMFNDYTHRGRVFIGEVRELVSGE
jgi:UDP-N-acetylmuramoylalanine-D-glutamate ligase